MNNFWIWLIRGLLPYYINLQQRKNEKTLEVRALFLSLIICWRNKKNYKWTIECPLIKRSRK